MLGVWLDELWHLLGYAFLLLIIGWLAGHPLPFLLLGAAAYLAWHIINLNRLLVWLKQGKKFQPPDSMGVWSEVFDGLYRLQTRNRKRKRKLTRMLGRFQEATTALPDVTVVLSVSGEIEWFNTAAQELIGLRWPLDAGQRIANLLRHPSFVEYLNSGDYAHNIEVPSPVDPGVVLSVLVVPYGEGKRLLVARDITRIHRLEQIRRDFVANVSHELRTPLTVVSGYLEALNEDAAECPAHWARALQLMQQQAARMQTLVNDLLMLSRLETDQSLPTLSEVDVAELLASILREARALSGTREHSFLVEADATLGILGSREELLSAFSNLLFNAVQYTPAQGEIVIRWFRSADSGHLEVSDSGEGIAPHHLPRLTERFYRVDAGRSRLRGGTGLGLAIVKHVLNRHGAVLRIDSELGQGSTFSCDFPAEAIIQIVPAGLT